MKLNYVILLGLLIAGLQGAGAADTNVVAAADGGGFSGKVAATMNSAGYTYVQVDTGSKKIWAATTQFPVKVGDRVTVGPGTAMDHFHSKTLNRDFDVVYFTGSINVDGAPAASIPTLPPGHPPINGAAVPAIPNLPPGHPSLTAPPGSAVVDLTGIKKAEGGETIEEIYAGKAKLAGKAVSVRGRVVKYNASILGRNWLHVRDGSGNADKGDNDLTVTTTTPAALGATVLVNGIISTNRDFGAGYKYNVIIEDAKVTVE